MRGMRRSESRKNPWISLAFNMVQGFERFTVTRGSCRTEAPETSAQSHETAGRGRLAAERRGQRPPSCSRQPAGFARPTGFAPRTVPAARRGSRRGAWRVAGAGRLPLSRPTRLRARWAILRGLYLGGVDGRRREAGGAARAAALGGIDGNLVNIVTSDHGEQFGEHRMVATSSVCRPAPSRCRSWSTVCATSLRRSSIRRSSYRRHADRAAVRWSSYARGVAGRPLPSSLVRRGRPVRSSPRR